MRCNGDIIAGWLLRLHDRYDSMWPWHIARQRWYRQPPVAAVAAFRNDTSAGAPQQRLLPLQPQHQRWQLQAAQR